MKNNFGFIRQDRFTGNYVGHQLDVSHMDFATTREFDSIGKNHCGSVMVTNMALYYSIGADRRETFKDIHRIIGNGPVLIIQRKARRAFKSLGYKLETRRLKDSNEIIGSLNRNIPVAFLIASGLFSMHWIFVLGYRFYENQLFYLIQDGWNKHSLKLYNSKSGALLVNSISFRLIK